MFETQEMQTISQTLYVWDTRDADNLTDLNILYTRND